MSDLTQMVTSSSSTEQPKSETPAVSPPAATNTGNVAQHPNNVIFNALDMIDNQLFYREERQVEPPPRGGLVTESLNYLVGDHWNFYSTSDSSSKSM